MLSDIRLQLVSLKWEEGSPPPAVDLDLYFEGNTDEGSIAPNQWGEGRPPVADIYQRFRDIAQRDDVERVLVGLHPDWNSDAYEDTFPPAEYIYIYSSARRAEVESWLAGLKQDGVLKGWPYGKPAGSPHPSRGYEVFSVCWD